MSTDDLQRKLAAILSADVQGYSRLMGDDEEATVRMLSTCRGAMETLIDEHHGRVVDAPGDNLLAEFGSVVAAVRCAVAIQERLRLENDPMPEARRMRFRIGINLGDVVVRGESIFGDGVNIAARIEALADAGGVSISGTVFDQVRNKLPFGFEFQGEHQVKNIEHPVRVYRVVTAGAAPDGAAPAGAAAARAAPTTSAEPDRRSIAVLPFLNMSGDSEQEYFSDGLTEDLITDLSRISGLLVIARNSSFTYKGQSVKADQVGRELGVRYVLEGSVRKAGGRVRITAQLIDAGTGGHVWAERYDRDLGDIFAVQDDVTCQIVTALTAQFTEHDRALVAAGDTDDPEAYDYVLRGKGLLNRTTREGNVRAKTMFERAIELDPDYAAAYAHLGTAYLNDWTLGFSADPTSLDRADELGRRALELDETLPEAHSLIGMVHVAQGRKDAALAELETALACCPNDPDALVNAAHVVSLLGQPEKSIEYVERARRVDPHSNFFAIFTLGVAHYLLGDLDRARRALIDALDRNPDFHPAHFFLAATYSELGQIDRAREHVVATMERWKMGSAAEARRRLAFEDPAVIDRILDALRRAGLPN